MASTVYETEISTGKFNAVGDPAMNWSTISGWRRNISSRFMLQKPG